jgi:predicted Zn finger-like uncharacterized protein
MPQFTCPSCSAVLKRDQDVPAGKKIRCPKCETIFDPNAPATAVAAGKPAAPRPAPKKIDDDLVADNNPYAVVRDQEEEDKTKAEKERAAMGLVKDRFKKSKRGPASRELVRPSNILMAVGVIRCVLAIALFVVGMFPLVFSDFYSTKPKAGQKYADVEKEKKNKMSPEEWNELVIERCFMMGGAVLDFIWGAIVCIGANKMGSLESYSWAWVGAIMGLLTCLPVGIWCIIVLNNPIVKAGFTEEKPEQA